MRKLEYLLAFLFVGLLLVGASASFAQSPTETHYSPDVDGFVWMMSTDAEKKAFLFGAGSAVAMEYHVRAIRAEEPSIFVKGWTEALKDMSWSELASKLDAFYSSKPDRKNLLVFEVIWNEVIKPRLQS